MRSADGSLLERFLFIAIHLLTAFLFVLRRPALAVASGMLPPMTAIGSMVSVYLYEWNTESALQAVDLGGAMVCLGALLCLGATLNLGLNFAVLPSYRGLTSSGLYGIVRHPLYASYVVMDLGVIAQCPTHWNLVVFVVSATLVLFRMSFEERLLSQKTSYEEYRTLVPYKLLPLIW
jgi:protein-S-isoprenylcysteine O-methyltransferase Ste14